MGSFFIGLVMKLYLDHLHAAYDGEAYRQDRMAPAGTSCHCAPMAQYLPPKYGKDLTL